MPDCNFEHERELGKDEAGYRCGARYVHGVGAGLWKDETREKKKKVWVMMLYILRRSLNRGKIIKSSIGEMDSGVEWYLEKKKNHEARHLSSV